MSIEFTGEIVLKTWKQGVIFVSVLILLSLTACTGAEAPAGTEEKQITLSVWNVWPENNDANAKSFYETLAQWQQEYPHIAIKVYATDSEAYKGKIRIAVSTGEAPDVFFSWGCGFSKPFAESGALLP